MHFVVLVDKTDSFLFFTENEENKIKTPKMSHGLENFTGGLEIQNSGDQTFLAVFAVFLWFECIESFKMRETRIYGDFELVA